MEKLKPCPFCGGEATVADDSGRHGEMFSVWHQCPNDGGRFNRYGSVDALIIDTGWYDTREQAIEAWNRRAGECDSEALLSVCAEIDDADVDGCIDWADRIRKAIGDDC